jgi:hypothetical protein
MDNSEVVEQTVLAPRLQIVNQTRFRSAALLQISAGQN